MNKTVEELKAEWKSARVRLISAPWHSTSIAEMKALSILENRAWRAHRAAVKKEQL